MILKVTSRIARWGRLLFLPRFGCSYPPLPDRNSLFISFFAICFLFVLNIQHAYAIQLSSDSKVATAGYYQLLWSGQSKQFQLQESFSADFNTYELIYEGKDLARVVSGKPNGDYFYRVSAGENNSLVSNIVKVTVSHHPLENAILFFIAGAIVFISTLILILNANKKQTN